MAFDVAIVGAGIVGAACAAALTREGLKVVLIDQCGPATSSTAAGMGHIVVMDDSEAQFALTAYSLALWNKLADEMPASCEYDYCGTIWVAADGEDMDEVRRKHESYGERGIVTEILDERSLCEAEPNLAEGLAGGLLVSGDRVVYQLAATQWFVDQALSGGATLRRDSRVIGIADGQVRLADGEQIAAGEIVNAAGIGASYLTPWLKIRRRKGHLVITERARGFVRHQLVELGYLKSAHGPETDSVALNLQPRSTDQVLIGSSRQFDVEHGDIDHRILRRMIEKAFTYVPKLQALTAVRTWTGFRPATADNLPYIGLIPGFQNIYAAAGHEGLGITMATGTAALIADQILDRDSAIPIQRYLPDRDR